MKILSISEFKSLIARKDWEREQEINEIDRDDVQGFGLDDAQGFGLASKTSRLGDIEITYTEGFNYDKGDPDSLSLGTEGQEEKVWSVKGIRVIQENGYELNENEMGDYLEHIIPEEIIDATIGCLLEDYHRSFSGIDYSLLFNEK